MAKWLVTWEAGGYLGHEMLVTSAALQLRGAGHEVVIVGPLGARPNHAVLAAGVTWIALPHGAAPRPPDSGPRWKSRATSLRSFGFHSAEWLRQRLGAWRSLLTREQPDGVALQAAPCAQLAARAAGVPAIEFGIGFDVPPRRSPFPAFRNPLAFDVESAKALEGQLLGAIPAEFRSSESSLADCVSGDRRLVVSLPELDHYGGISRGLPDPSRVFAGPLPTVDFGGEPLHWTSAGPRVLVYVRASAADVPRLLSALGQATAATEPVAGSAPEFIVICPNAAPAHASSARRAGWRLFPSAVSLSHVLPTADLVVCHGGGLMGEALVRGIPCVAMPIHHEQLLAASSMVRHGLGVMLDPRDAAGLARACQRALGDLDLRARARALAVRRRELAAHSGQTLIAAAQSLIEGRD